MPFKKKRNQNTIQQQPRRASDIAEAGMCKQSFWRFVTTFWDTVPGSQPLKANWHMRVIADIFQEMSERVFVGLPKLHDYLVNISPGSSKTSLVSILGPAWIWTRMPSARIISASGTSDLVLDLSAKTRDVINSEKYQKLFPGIDIREDVNAKGLYRNSHGGERKVCTVSGISPIGTHGHFLICDDPIDPKKVLSQAEVETARKFIEEILPTRVVDKNVSVTFLVMQRLGLGDSSDVMLKIAEKEGSFPVYHVNLPAELEKDENGEWIKDHVKPIELADNYVDGLMDPLRLPKRYLTAQKARGNLYYMTQFQQRPYAASGGMFKEEYFNQRVKTAPYASKRVIYIDRASTAAKDNKNACFTSIVLMAKDQEGNYYVERVERGQWEPYERNQKIKAFAMFYRSKYGPKYDPIIWVEAEGGSSGRDAWKDLAKTLSGFRVREHKITRMGSKQTRAEPWSCQLAAKNVFLVDNGESEGTGKANWDINEYIKEHCQFPSGRWADQVDSSCLVAGTLIETINGEIPIESVKQGDFVLTRDGYKEVLKSWCTGDTDVLVSVLFCNGSQLIGTPNHPVWTKNRGFVSLCDLTEVDEIMTVEEGKCLAKESKSNARFASVLISDQGTEQNKSHRIPVYNLEVKDTPEFFANGVLVHNSGSFSVLNNAPTQTQGLRVYGISTRKKRQLRIVPIARDNLVQYITDHRSLLISVQNPAPLGTGERPIHALNKMLESVEIQCVDMDPRDHQETWEEIIPPFGKPIQELVMSLDQAKKIWTMVLKKRELPVETIVIQDEGEGAAKSIAMALCDCLHLSRGDTIFPYDETLDEENRVVVGEKEPPPNEFIFSVVKKARGMVV